MKLRPIKAKPRVSRNTWILLLLTAALFLFAVWVLSPSGSSALHREKEDMGLRLGLDLKGGVHLVYQADFPENTTDEEKATEMDAMLAAIETRINTYGVVEPIIQRQGNDRILVQLPGITNTTQAKQLIEQTAFLEFREIEANNNNPVTLGDYLDGNRTEFFDTGVPGSRIFTYTGTNVKPVAILKIDQGVASYVDNIGNPIDVATLESDLDARAAYSWMPAVGQVTKDGVTTQEALTGRYLASAKPGFDESSSQIVVDIEWKDDGVDLFDQIAARLYPKSSPLNDLGIFLDNQLISSPTIMQSEYEGKAEITGKFTSGEAKLLASQLSSGALPVPLKQPPLYEKHVSATLGADFVDRAVIAGIVGLLVVMLFMMLYYRLPGVLAALALLIYAALVLAIFKLIPVTLTLPGIAGFVVSLGMAVDANVLIFERMKEELRAGRTIKAAIEAGFSRAWPAIRDSNITTFIACGILYWFGNSVVASSAVMGFALTLFIGVAVSMFSAIAITRTFLLLFTGAWSTKRLTWFGVQEKSV